MNTTVTMSGSHALKPPAALGAGAGVSAAAASSGAGRLPSGVWGLAGMGNYRLRLIRSCKISSLVVIILALASKSRCAVIKLAIWPARSTLDDSREPA